MYIYNNYVLMPSEDEIYRKDPQFDVILSNFPFSKDYSLLLTCIVLRGPSSHGITHDLFSNHCGFLSLLKFMILYKKAYCTRVI